MIEPPSATLAVALRLTPVVSSGPATASSVIVAVPLALALPVLPAVTVAVSVKVSAPSAIGSSLVATRTCTEVWPAASVTPAAVTGCQAAPSNHSSAVAVSVPTTAVPLASVGTKVTSPVLGVDRLTVKTAKPLSTTAVSDTAISEVSLSLIVVATLPDAPLSTRFSKLPPLADASATFSVSTPSASASSIVAMLKLALLAPAGMMTVATPVKSAPSAAVPLYVMLTVTAVCAGLVSETV